MSEQVSTFRRDSWSAATSAYGGLITPGKRSPSSLLGQGAFHPIGKLKALAADPAPLPSPAQLTLQQNVPIPRLVAESPQPVQKEGVKRKASEDGNDTQDSDLREQKYNWL